MMSSYHLSSSRRVPNHALEGPCLGLRSKQLRVRARLPDFLLTPNRAVVSRSGLLTGVVVSSEDDLVTSGLKSPYSPVRLICK